MVVRKLSWQVVVFCVACGKIAGFDDLHGAGGSDDHEAGDAGEHSNAGKGGSGANGSVAGAGIGGGSGQGAAAGGGGSGAAGGSFGGEGGAGDVSGAGATGGSAGAAASGGGAGMGGTPSSGGVAGTDVTAGTSGMSAGSSGAMNGGVGGGAGTAGSAGAGGGAGIGNPSGCGELLANGNFEAGRLGWEVMSSYPNLELNVHPAIAEREGSELVAVGVTPHSGDFLGWVGGVPDSNREYNVFVTQRIVVSDNVTDLLFTGFLSIQSEEPLATSYDDLYVEILDAEYDRVWQFGAFSNQHQGPDWFAVDSIDPYPDDLDLLRGRELRFGVYSRTDPEVPTHFFFDSLSLVAICD